MINLLVGPSGSGKTTYTIAKVKENIKDFPIRINRDSLRKMLYGDDLSEYYKLSNLNSFEKFITNIEDEVIKLALDNNKDVYIDNTNLNPKYVNLIMQKFLGRSDIHSIPMDEISSEELKDRVKKRDGLSDSDVSYIDKQVNKFKLASFSTLFVDYSEKVEWNKELPTAIIIDVDGTIAKLGDRDIYDGSKVYLDTVIEPVKEIVNALHNQYTVIICTGRDEAYKDVTEKWLVDNGVKYDLIYTRPKDDTRRDSVVKLEIFNKYIRGVYNILTVFNDRLQVIEECWNPLGLHVCNVNQGNIRF